MLDPPHQKQNDEDDHYNTDDADAAVTVAAEAATEAAGQEDDENDDEDQSDRHGPFKTMRIVGCQLADPLGIPSPDVLRCEHCANQINSVRLGSAKRNSKKDARG
jgi:hypothetical protein